MRSCEKQASCYKTLNKTVPENSGDTWEGGKGGGDPPIFSKTIVSCSETMEMHDVIFSNNR